MSKSGRTASSSPIFVIPVSQTPIPVVYTFEYGLGGRLLLSQMSGERTVMSVRQDLYNVETQYGKRQTDCRDNGSRVVALLRLGSGIWSTRGSVMMDGSTT